MTDLVSRIREVVEEQRALAEATDLRPEAQWYTGTDLTTLSGAPWIVLPQDAPFIAARSPADALAECRYALGVLERHQPRYTQLPKGYEEMAALVHTGPWCSHGQLTGIVISAPHWPCDALLALAERWNIPTTPTEEPTQ